MRQVSRTSQQALKYLEQDTRVQQASPYKNLPVLSSNLYSSSPNKYANNQNNPIMGQFVYTSNTSQVCLVLVAFAINLAALPLQCGFLRLPEGSLDFVSWHHPRSFHPSFLSCISSPTCSCLLCTEYGNVHMYIDSGAIGYGCQTVVAHINCCCTHQLLLLTGCQTVVAHMTPHRLTPMCTPCINLAVLMCGSMR